MEVKQVKILHCADVHLGAELTTLGRSAVSRRAEIKKTFMNIFKLCKTEEIQLLLIAGYLKEFQLILFTCHQHIIEKAKPYANSIVEI